MNWRRIAGISLALLCLGSASWAARRPPAWQGRVTYVSDGDTLWVQAAHGGAARKIRVDGIDAPEICQAYGVVAREQLVQRLAGQKVQVLPRRRDDYGRLLARVMVQGQDVGRWMVLHGHAWSYHYRGQAGPYARQQAWAQRRRLGLWQAVAEMPRKFRQRHGSCH